MASGGRDSQIENRIFLAPVGFKFIEEKSQVLHFMCNQANIPDISLGEASNQHILEIFLHQEI